MKHPYSLPVKAIAFVCSVLCYVNTSAQITTAETAKGKAKEYFIMADNDAAYRKYYAADSFARMAVREKDNFIDAWMLIGELNMQAFSNYKEGCKAYEKVKALDANYYPDVNLQLAICYMNNSEYAKAKAELTTYLARPKLAAESRMVADKMLLDCDFAVEAVKNPVNFNPVNLGANVNTADDESMPSLTADGKYLYFTKHYGDGMYSDEDIYMSINTSAGFAKASNMSEAINTEDYIEGAHNVSASGKYLFFTSADRRDGVGRADIYMSRKAGEQWERPNNIGGPINTPGYETQPCISADGKALYYAGIRSTGLGGTDIWVSYLGEDGRWGQPQNLGATINTMYDEMRPFIHPDGSTLYFSSRGHTGMGNFDLYVSHKDDKGVWSKPVNMGYPINTAGDELGIYVTADGSSAYYASAREGGFGEMDIYKFDMPAQFKPQFTSYIRGNVFDADTREVIHANVQVYDLESGKLYTTLSGDKLNGIFLSTLPAGKNYGVVVMKDGYLFYSQNISLIDVKEGTPFEVNIGLSKIKVGGKVVLNNVFFESDKAELKPQSKSELGVLIKLLEKNPLLKIEIGGHTDNTGGDEKNKTLSENRAKNVYEYLVNQGVSVERLSYKGYASSKPVSPNDTPENKAKNRRTEFTVTAI